MYTRWKSRQWAQFVQKSNQWMIGGDTTTGDSLIAVRVTGVTFTLYEYVTIDIRVVDTEYSYISTDLHSAGFRFHFVLIILHSAKCMNQLKTQIQCLKFLESSLLSFLSANDPNSTNKQFYNKDCYREKCPKLQELREGKSTFK